MFWTPHVIIGIIVSALLYPIYGLNVLIILISNILIDADHYLWYVWKIRDNPSGKGSVDVLKKIVLSIIKKVDKLNKDLEKK